ncbi:hypothetical protein ACFLVO_00515 [Chloroflexota bacterium]
MSKCPNCGRMVERTEDWACQWCGYPLLSTSYKKIPKTYRQLREERRGGQTLLTPEAEPEPVAEVEPEPVAEAEPEPVAEAEPEPVAEAEPEPVAEAEPEPVAEAEPEPVAEAEPEPVAEAEPEPVAEVEPEPVAEVEPEPVAEAEPEPVAEVESKPLPEPEPGTVVVTVEELYSAYSADEVEADIKFTDKTLRVTGVVDRVTINDTHGIYYIILVGTEKKAEWNVRCTFDRRYGTQLSRLAERQTVVVRGKYGGYRVNILMQDCVLVS